MTFLLDEKRDMNVYKKQHVWISVAFVTIFVASEAWSTHRDHNSVHVVVVVRSVTLLVPNQLRLKRCINAIQSLQKCKASYNIQVKFKFGDYLQSFD